MRLTLLDWRRQVARLYADVRAAPDPRDGHDLWRAGRDRLLAEHPDSPLDRRCPRRLHRAPRRPPTTRPCASRSPSTPPSPPLQWSSSRRDGDGVVPFSRIGGGPPAGPRRPRRVVAGVLRRRGLRAGADTRPTDTYGGGRYVLDTVKGADLGGDAATGARRRPQLRLQPVVRVLPRLDLPPRPRRQPPVGPGGRASEPLPWRRGSTGTARKHPSRGDDVGGRAMIRGLRRAAEPARGRRRLTLRVATDAPRFRVELHRCGARMSLVPPSGWLPGRDAPPHLPFHDWGRPNTGLHGEPLAPWPAYELPVGERLASGVYVAVSSRATAHGHDRTDPDRTTPDGREAARAVRRPRPDARPRRSSTSCPLLTYHAYNLAGGEPYDPGTASRAVVLLQRAARRARSRSRSRRAWGCTGPGGGTGATPYDVFNTDPFDPTPAPDVRALGRPVRRVARARPGTRPTTAPTSTCTAAAATCSRRTGCSSASATTSTGATRCAPRVEGYVDGGGNVAFFSGNTCWWRVVFDDDVTVHQRLHFWHEPDRPGDPENALVGVSFRNGGERDRDDLPVPVGLPGAARRPLGLRRHRAARRRRVRRRRRTSTCSATSATAPTSTGPTSTPAARSTPTGADGTPEGLHHPRGRRLPGRAAGASATARPRWACSAAAAPSSPPRPPTGPGCYDGRRRPGPRPDHAQRPRPAVGRSAG